MEYFYIAEIMSNNNDESTIVLKNEINEEEVKAIKSAFSLCAPSHAITEIKDIVIENGMEFKRWMDAENLQKMRTNGMSAERLVLNSNKLVLNYASSIKTYIDIETRLLIKKKENMLEHFEKITHDFYDTHIEYRFWSNFRNFVVHCALPYTGFREAVGENCEVFCEKRHLLSFNNWKHSRKDIEQMPDNIDLVKMVDDMSSLIYALYLDFYYIFSQEIVDSVKAYAAFCDKYKVESPVIFKSLAPKDILHGSMYPFPVERLYQMLEIVEKHPSVNLKIKK